MFTFTCNFTPAIDGSEPIGLGYRKPQEK